MKKFILLTFLFAALFSQIEAQNNVTLNINHKLGEADFAMEQAAKNNMDHDFHVTRLEYYIAEISLVHDGGIETNIEDLWILANADTKTEVELGDFDITSVEKIQFHIGVDPEHNHLDPSSYLEPHPLAPKAPSMHWGWNAGYRFIAMEGKGGSALNQLFQLHGLGDNNYFMTEVEMDVTAEDNQITINIDADYTRALENIAVNSGVIVHGDKDEAKQCVENFRDFVFSPAGTSSSTIDFSEVKGFSTYPNPVTSGITTIKLEIDQDQFDYDVSITSVNGKQLQYLKSVNNGQQINTSALSSGVYFINLIKDGQSIISNKIIIQ